jgi:hypothetical protein
VVFVSRTHAGFPYMIELEFALSAFNGKGEAQGARELGPKSIQW